MFFLYWWLLKLRTLFHKAISQSGYTSSISYQVAYNLEDKNVNYINSKEVLKNIFNDKADISEIRNTILELPAYEFYSYFPLDNLREIPLLTNDGIVIPLEGLHESLKNPIDSSIPIIAGSNRDEVKLWIGTSLYFVQPKYSLLGSIFDIPKIEIIDENAFEAFNYYRSSAWQLRGVKQPLENLLYSGSSNLYAYRYDWDDHRRWPIANFKKIIGAAHATEIPLIAGNNKLVGNYGFIIYPKGPSKRFVSKNMMSFWGNFAKTGEPGYSSNNIKWKKYLGIENSNILIIDNKKSLQLNNISILLAH